MMVVNVTRRAALYTAATVRRIAGKVARGEEDVE